MTDQVLLRVDDIEKSPKDDREYRGLELKNHMKILLIRDENADISAAALNVMIGSIHEPLNLPGLAHFCEHMLFLGTEKYPEENEYKKFLQDHGGSCNAHTVEDNTCFYFDVGSNHLEGALERFSQFFQTPLFSENATEREMNAVNLEFENNTTQEMRRLFQLEKHLSKKDHPYRKFDIGNKKSLEILPKEQGIDIREELLKFHKKWYSSNIMTLAILGKESLDDMEELSIKLFSPIEDKGVKVPEWKEHPIPSPEYLQTKIFTVPFNDLRAMKIYFPIPDYSKYYRSKPASLYLSNLIGHEGPGSIHAFLKKQGLATEFNCEPVHRARGLSLFVLECNLTEEGINHVDEIVEHVFQYLQMLRKSGPQKWFFDELKDVAQMGFRFLDKEEPLSCVTSSVISLQEIPFKEILSGYFKLDQWKPELIEEVLNYLQPDNLMVWVFDKQSEEKALLEEPWYGTRYYIEHIPDEVLEKWTKPEECSYFELPPKNEYITSDFVLKPLEENASSEPKIIYESSLSRVWFKQDDEFLLPKLKINAEFTSPLPNLFPINSTLNNMFAELLNESLNEYTYSAQLAGLSWCLSSSKYGFKLYVGGFSNKIYILWKNIINKLSSFVIDPKRFTLCNESTKRNMNCFDSILEPTFKAQFYLDLILIEHDWDKDEIFKDSQNITQKLLEEYIKNMFSQIYIDMFIYGNCTTQEALKFSTLLEEKFSSKILTTLKPSHLFLNREFQLEFDSNYYFEVEDFYHSTSCIHNYYQTGLQNHISIPLLELLVQIIEEPCYSTLRTQEQLGYYVSCDVRISNGVHGLEIIIQSEKHPKYLDKRIEAFLATVDNLLNKLSIEDFEKYRDALITIRVDKIKTMYECFHLFWKEITEHKYIFNRNDLEIENLRKFTKQDIMDFYNEMIKFGAPKRRKLSVHVISKMEEKGASLEYKKIFEQPRKNGFHKNGILPKKITDIYEFKMNHGLYPLAPSNLKYYQNIFKKISESNIKEKKVLKHIKKLSLDDIFGPLLLN